MESLESLKEKRWRARGGDPTSHTLVLSMLVTLLLHVMKISSQTMKEGRLSFGFRFLGVYHDREGMVGEQEASRLHRIRGQEAEQEWGGGLQKLRDHPSHPLPSVRLSLKVPQPSQVAPATGHRELTRHKHESLWWTLTQPQCRISMGT